MSTNADEPAIIIESVSIEKTTEAAKQSNTLLERVRAWDVSDPAEFQGLQCFLRDRVAPARKFIVELYKSQLARIRDLKADLESKRDALLGPIVEAERIGTKKCVDWRAEEQRQVDEENRKAREAAKKKAEDEALKLAERLTEQGRPEAAEKMLTAAANGTLSVAMPAPIVAAPARVAGVTFPTSWSAEVVDKAALVKYVAANCDAVPALLAYLNANGPALNKVAQSQHEALAIPGVIATSSTGMSKRTV